MNSIRDQLATLAAEVQMHLLQHHHVKEWLLAEPETYLYFKQSAHTQKGKTPPKPLLKPPMPSPIIAKAPPPPVSAPIISKKETTSPQTEFKAEPTPTPPPPPPEPQEKKPPKAKGFFVPEPLPPAQPLDLADIRAIVQEKFPGLKLLDTLPEKLPVAPATVVVLTCLEAGPQREFLQNMTKAIDSRLAPAELVDAAEIEAKNSWESLLKAPELKLIIISLHEMQQCPGLMSHYKEVNKTGRAAFGKIPAFMLADPSIYMKEHPLKAALWRSICAEAKSLCLSPMHPSS